MCWLLPLMHLKRTVAVVPTQVTASSVAGWDVEWQDGPGLVVGKII